MPLTPVPTKFRVRPRDFIVITSERPLTIDQRMGIKENVHRVVGSRVGVLVLDHGLKLTWIRDGEVIPYEPIVLKKRPFIARFKSHYHEYRKFMPIPQAIYAAWTIALL